MNPIPPLLAGLDLVGLFDRAKDQRLCLDAGEWEPLNVSDVASEFPAFAVMDLIGRGGMGVVYRALQPDIEREVAIKLLPPELSLDPEFAERFRREAKLMASLQHEGLVAVYDFGETPSGNLFYVMEFVSGGDLAKRWKAGPMAANEAVAMIEQISAAVGCAHEAGIVHRDLKPANIMLAASGAPKVMDFGLARPVAVQSALSQLTLPDVAMGTPDYAAPEQLLAITQPTTAMDVYSLGVIAYEALTGQLPRGVFDSPSKLNSEVDPAFDAVILQALQSDPSRRFADAGAFRQSWLRAADYHLQQQLRERETRLKLLRRTRLTFAFGLVAFIAMAAATYGYWQQQRAFASRQSAEQMVDLIVDKMHGKLQDVGRVDLLADVDAEVGNYYAALPAEERSPARVLSEARFFQRRASMLRLKGDWEGAITNAHRAADLLVPAAQAAPGDVDAFVEAAQSLSTIAYMHGLRRDTSAGLPAAERMVGFVVAAMPRLPPDHRQVLFYYSRSLRRLADQQVLLERFDEAQKNYLSSAAAIQHTIAQPKPGPDLFTEAAQVETEIGDLASNRSDFDLAIEHYQLALDMQGRAVKPGVFKLSIVSRFQALNSYMAGAYQKKGEFGAAKPFIAECWTYTEQIFKRSPNSTDALEAERYYYRVLGPDLEHDGKHAESQIAIKKANEAYAKWNKLKIGVAGD
jgi:tetratricopeptide (TPR) repeat protein